MARSTTVSGSKSAGSRHRGWLRMMLVGILFLIGIGYISPAYSFYTRSQEIEGARAVNTALQATNDDLNTEKGRLMGGEYVEQVARSDLGLVKPGDQPFIVKDIDQDINRGVDTAVAEETGDVSETMLDLTTFHAVFPF